MLFVQIPAIILALLIFSPLTADAQEPAPLAKSVALFAGGGPGSMRSATLVIGLDVETRYGVFMGRAMTARETYALIPSKVPAERNSDYGLLYGWRVHLSSMISASFAAGVSATTIVRRGEFVESGSKFGGDRYEALRTWNIGLPFELRVQLTDDRGKGGVFLGLEGNVSRHESYGGLVLGAYFGT